MMVIGNVTFYTAKKINAFLREGAISSNLRKMHRQMFTMLLIQTACPLLFLHMPNFATFAYVFAGWSTPFVVSCTLTILVSLFPLSNGAVIIGFLSEYRGYTLSLLKIRRTTLKDETVVMADSKRMATV
ncbi:hypothetical protein Q1695_006728 [Nippostrongylus brasiliensis]|nr:hypothetical protein Q1695_006728 [Nippostrongylus brasiliensis]